MGAMNASLGQRCNFCHVQGDNASDDNPKKLVARQMMVMVNEINAKFPGRQGSRELLHVPPGEDDSGYGAASGSAGAIRGGTLVAVRAGAPACGRGRRNRLPHHGKDTTGLFHRFLRSRL